MNTLTEMAEALGRIAFALEEINQRQNDTSWAAEAGRDRGGCRTCGR
ncbi:hypothetical protein GS540_26555 [Rhodococcus hoagii]|nr:hypothetical protein [Prescottella equi]